MLALMRKHIGVRLQSPAFWANPSRCLPSDSTISQERAAIRDNCKTNVKCALAVILLLTCLSVAGCGGGAGATRGGGSGNGGSGGNGGGGGGSVSGISITSISPDIATAGSPDLTVTIQGSNFESIPGDIRMEVDWTTAGVSSTATNVNVSSSTQLTAVIPAALMAKPVTAEISVSKWHKADDNPLAVSNSLGFTVASGKASTPSISPPSATIGLQGSEQFTANMDGPGTFSWSVEEGVNGGTITSNGFYTAPDRTGTFHVIVTASSAPNTSASATVNVTSSGFTPTGAMHVGRTGHTATLLNDGRVLIVGGGDSTAELFDPATGTFSETGPPITGRLGATATLLADGRVLIAGGLGLTAGPDGFLLRLNSAEIFNPATGTFTATGSMIQARRLHTATLLGDGHVLVAGGYFDAICTTASTELFDPATGTFSSTGFMLTERVHHTATLLDGGEVLMAGGSNGCAPDSSDDPPWDPLFVELYEPGPGNFIAGGDMSTTRIGHAAIRLSDGKVLMLGGIPAVQNLDQQPPKPSYAEDYAPATGIFSPVEGLTFSQKSYTATLLTSGKVLIAGGVDEQGDPTPEADLIDPAAGALNATGGLVTARVGHTATLLKDGRVLVTGGTDSNRNATATAELYK